MRIARGKTAIVRRVVRIFLDREEELRHGLVEAAAKEERPANYGEREADLGTRAKTQRGLGVFDRHFELARPKPQAAADVPSAGKARIEDQRAIDQSHHRADVLAEIRQRQRSVDENARIVARHLQRPPGEVSAFAAASKSWLRPSMQSRRQQRAAQARAGP